MFYAKVRALFFDAHKWIQSQWMENLSIKEKELIDEIRSPGV